MPAEAASHVESQLALEERLVERTDVIEEVLAKVDDHLAKHRPLIAEAPARLFNGRVGTILLRRPAGPAWKIGGVRMHEIREQIRRVLENSRNATNNRKAASAA